MGRRGEKGRGRFFGRGGWGSGARWARAVGLKICMHTASPLKHALEKGEDILSSPRSPKCSKGRLAAWGERRGREEGRGKRVEGAGSGVCGDGRGELQLIAAS